jgi:CheY-like chemotaxis protein
MNDGAYRVLIVEDDLDNAEALRILLEFWGYRVEAARDREDAFRCAQAKLPDAIILDMGLPTFADGCAFVTQLRALPGADAMLIIANTGYGRETDRRKAIGAGCDFFFVKPADLDQVHGALGAIDLRRASVASARGA